MWFFKKKKKWTKDKLRFIQFHNMNIADNKDILHPGYRYIEQSVSNKYGYMTTKLYFKNVSSYTKTDEANKFKYNFRHSCLDKNKLNLIRSIILTNRVLKDKMICLKDKLENLEEYYRENDIIIRRISDNILISIQLSEGDRYYIDFEFSESMKKYNETISMDILSLYYGVNGILSNFYEQAYTYKKENML